MSRILCLLTTIFLAAAAAAAAAPTAKKAGPGAAPGTSRPAPARSPSRPAPEPEKQEGVRGFLNVKTWYLTLSVSVQAHDGTTATLVSSTTANAALDWSELGPSITLDRKNVSAQEHVNQIGNSRFWIITAPTTAENETYEQSSVRVRHWVDSTAVLQQLTYDSQTESDQSHASGIGRLPAGGLAPYVFEVDVARKIYAVKLPYTFLDSEDSHEGVKGERRFKSGDEWLTEKIARGFSSFLGSFRTITPPIEDVGMAYILQGPLPDEVTTIHGSKSFDFEMSAAWKGTLTMEYDVSPTPPVQVELVFQKDASYRAWRPTGGADEKTRGPDPLSVTAKLQKKGGGEPPFKASRFLYKLLNVSRERGVCMNWPPDPLAEPIPDLQIQRDPSQFINRDLLITDDEGQSAAATGDQMTEAHVVISSFDWGAHGDLEIVAELENGNRVTAIVPETQEQALPIPLRKPGSNVAFLWATLRGVVDVRDESDDEDSPKGDGFRGDGFTQYEEYRGFMEGGKWTDADPRKKDVFVLNLLRCVPEVKKGVSLYETLTKLAVHSKLVETEIRLDHVINFNHSQGPHLVDQHVIYIREGGETHEGFEVSQVDEVGTPGTAHAVNIFVSWNAETGFGSAEATTVAHEMLHSSNVWHHGECDKKVAWHVSVDSNGKAHVTEHEGGWVFDPSTTVATVASWVGLGEVEIRREDGSPVSPRDLPSGDDIIWLGLPHGQHSGDYDCVMKYTCVSAYPSASEPDVRYLATPEPQGRGICTDSEGTKYNAADHKPQSRFGNAAMTAGAGVKLPRGDCAHQIRVNDMGDEPQR
jgi:hypothetical protein